MKEEGLAKRSVVPIWGLVVYVVKRPYLALNNLYKRRISMKTKTTVITNNTPRILSIYRTFDAANIVQKEKGPDFGIFAIDVTALPDSDGSEPAIAYAVANFEPRVPEIRDLLEINVYRV